jgi:hypothetical protein
MFYSFAARSGSGIAESSGFFMSRMRLQFSVSSKRMCLKQIQETRELPQSVKVAGNLDAGDMGTSVDTF